MLDLIAGFVAGSVVESVAEELGIASAAREVAGTIFDGIVDPVVGSTSSSRPRRQSSASNGNVYLCKDNILKFWKEPGKRMTCFSRLEDFENKSKVILKDETIESFFEKKVGRLILDDKNEVIVHPPKPGYYETVDIHMHHKTERREKTIELARMIAATRTYNFTKSGTFNLNPNSYSRSRHQVDLFAACLLMPSQREIKAVIRGIPTRPSQIAKMCMIYHVRESWASYRLASMGL